MIAHRMDLFAVHEMAIAKAQPKVMPDLVTSFLADIITSFIHCLLGPTLLVMSELRPVIFQCRTTILADPDWQVVFIWHAVVVPEYTCQYHSV